VILAQNLNEIEKSAANIGLMSI